MNLIFSSYNLSTGLLKAVMNNQCGFKDTTPRGGWHLWASWLFIPPSPLISSLSCPVSQEAGPKDCMARGPVPSGFWLGRPMGGTDRDACGGGEKPEKSSLFSLCSDLGGSFHGVVCLHGLSSLRALKIPFPYLECSDPGVATDPGCGEPLGFPNPPTL